MVSIIIPVLNEEEQMSLISERVRKSFGKVAYEVIIVDGGSTDRSPDVARRYGFRVLRCGERGRARQMNFGARHASGEILYFLHADTIPPVDAGSVIMQAIQTDSDAGCFRLRFDDDHPALRFYSWFTGFDIDLFRFGDQSLFIRREAFEETGGFDEDLMVMEDQDFVRRIKKGYAFRILPDEVVTSARKYRQNGYIRLQLIFALILLLYYIGLSQKAIVHLYQDLLWK